VAPVFVCEPALCAFQLNQEVGELRVLRASLTPVERAAEAGGALARQPPLALALELRGSVAVELQETQCRRIVGGAGGGDFLRTYVESTNTVDLYNPPPPQKKPPAVARAVRPRAAAARARRAGCDVGHAKGCTGSPVRF
jgi:hypothetical protein